MREQRDWALTVNAARILLAVLLIWFRADVVFAAGGGMAWLLVEVSAAPLRYGDPKLSRILTRIVLHTYLIFLLSFLAGLPRVSEVNEFGLSALMGGTVALSLFNLMTSVTLFFPPFSRPAELPEWAQHLWGKLSFLALPGLLLVGVLPGLAVTRAIQGWDAEVLPLLAIGSHLVLVSSIGLLALQGLPRGIADQSLAASLRRVLRLAPAWFVVGSIIEIFRGMWVEWIMVSATVAITLAWIYGAAARRPAERRLVPGPIE